MAQASNDGRNTVIPDGARLNPAEKRASLAAMRTGIAVCALPLSVFDLWIATLRHYDVLQVRQVFIPMSGLCSFLLVLSACFISHASFEK